MENDFLTRQAKRLRALLDKMDTQHKDYEKLCRLYLAIEARQAKQPTEEIELTY
jgi:nitric oxide reductase activation protein